MFDGRQRTPYDESSVPCPLNVYGASKLEGERRMLDADPFALVVRTSAFFGPSDEHNFVTLALTALAEGQPWAAADDVTVSATYVPDLADAVLDLLVDGESGIWHLANPGAISWAELARRAALLAGLDPDLVRGMPSASLDLAAPRPAYTVLASRRGWVLPDLEQALHRYVAETAERWRGATLAGPAA